MDGTLHFGEVVELDADAGLLTLLVEEEIVSVPVADVGSIVISGESAGSKANVAAHGSAGMTEALFPDRWSL